MKSRQIWITAGTAVVSFALGIAFASSWRKPDAELVAEIRQTKANDRSGFATRSSDTEELSGKTRAGKRDEKKKPGEPRISIPLNAVAKNIKDRRFDSNVMAGCGGIETNLSYLGATEAEATEIKNSLKRAQDEILAAEKKFIKVIQTNETQIQLDDGAMRDVAASVSRQFQTDIRSTLSGEVAELLISSVEWNQFYPTDKESFATLKIIRTPSGEMRGMTMVGEIKHFRIVYGGFADDGTPIPADQVFDDRWKPFLKGLTLLPQNEK